jgi:hypothetical protein
VNYKYRAVEKFWRNFYKLRPEQKESIRRAWQVFKSDPFHPSLGGSHEIHELSARAKHTIYAAVIEAEDLSGLSRAAANGRTKEVEC